MTVLDHHHIEFSCDGDPPVCGFDLMIETRAVKEWFAEAMHTFSQRMKCSRRNLLVMYFFAGFDLCVFVFYGNMFAVLAMIFCLLAGHNYGSLYMLARDSFCSHRRGAGLLLNAMRRMAELREASK